MFRPHGRKEGTCTFGGGWIGLPTETKSKDTYGLERHFLALGKRAQLLGLLVQLWANVAHCQPVSK